VARRGAAVDGDPAKVRQVAGDSVHRLLVWAGRVGQRTVEEDLAERVQTLGGRVAAVVGAVAVGPLVVTWVVDERILEPIEVGPTIMFLMRLSTGAA
jgi:hypothetical protein